MNKATEFLEKNVEWLALGLGGIFLLWMVWAYVINPPVTVKIGGEELALGEVDRYILRGKAAELRGRMDDQSVATFVFPNMTQAWVRAIENATIPQAPRLPRFATNFQGTRGAAVVTIPGVDDAPEQVYVTALPDLPEPVPATKDSGSGKPVQLVSKGVSLVLVPQAAGQGAAPGATPQPVMNASQPGGNGVQEDRLWITLKYLIPMKPLHEDLQQKKYYQALNNNVATAFVSVEVEREELVGPDEWGNRKPIPRLPVINDLPPVPNPQDVQAVQQYLQWVEANTVYILKPPFYATTAGVTWTPPGWVPPPVVQVEPQQPQQPAETPEQIRERRRMELEQRRQAAQQRRSSRSSGDDNEDRPRRSRRDRSEEPAVRDDDRPGSRLHRRLPYPQAMPPGYNRRPPGIPEDAMPPDVMAPPPPASPQQPGQVQPEPPVVPQEVVGRFVPTATTPDVDFWIHDASVEAGKTYRYRVRYKMLNPIFNAFNVAKPADLQKQFLIESDWSAWSDPVPMDSLSQYFVSGGLREDSGTFEVYKWENGAMNLARFDNVRPGDVIGGRKKMPDGKEVDFSTGVTVVDVRQQGPRNERVVLLVDTRGNLITRDFRTDQADPNRKELERKAEEDRLRLQQQRPGEAPAAGARP